ncbi:MAG: FAD-dependent oxidoreductase [Variovorax sp.]|nr:MAG: FAD-dependent oxidoreductase [Variovorax sp.]
MRVLVLGAGLLGVTSAYYLQQLGHEVTVVDRHATPAAKARGRVAPSSFVPPSRAASPAPAGPGVMLVRRLRALVVALRAKWPRAARPDPLENMVRLGAYSRETVRALRDEAGVPQAQRSAGLLNFYMDRNAFEAATARAPRLHALGCEAQCLSAEDTVQTEPALTAMREQLAGAFFAAEDPSRDPAAFAASMVFLCRAAGVRFLTNHTVVALHEGTGSLNQVELTDGDGQTVFLRAHAYLLALGTASVSHADALGIDMPLNFVREYTAIIPVKDVTRAPRHSLHDQSGKLRIKRIETPEGDALRVSALVRAVDDNETFEPDSDRFDAIKRRVNLLLPGATDIPNARLHTAVHAVSADGLPLIGKTRLRNLFLNTAPGAPGWVNACGAGKSIARIVSGLRPELAFSFTGM